MWQCGADIKVVVDVVVTKTPRLRGEGVGAAGTFAFASLVALHSSLVPFFIAGVKISSRGSWKVRDNVCIVDHPICFWNNLGIIVGELVIANPRLSEGVDCIGCLVELLDVSCCQDGEGTAKAVSSDDDSCISVESVKAFNVTEDGGLNCQVKLIEAFGNLTPLTLVKCFSGCLELINECADAVSALEAYHDAAQRGRVACESSYSAVEVDEGLGKGNFVFLA